MAEQVDEFAKVFTVGSQQVLFWIDWTGDDQSDFIIHQVTYHDGMQVDIGLRWEGPDPEALEPKVKQAFAMLDQGAAERVVELTTKMLKEAADGDQE